MATEAVENNFSAKLSFVPLFNFALQPPEQTAAGYSGYRIGNSDETKRAIDEIPPEELANAMYEVLIDFNSCEKDTLFRETVKLFGLSAVTSKARKFLEYGLNALQKSGRI